MTELILLHLFKMLILENLYFTSNIIELSAFEPKLPPFINFDVHLGGHLEFTHLDSPEVILVCLVAFLICENLYFATNFIKLADLDTKI